MKTVEGLILQRDERYHIWLRGLLALSNILFTIISLLKSCYLVLGLSFFFYNRRLSFFFFFGVCMRVFSYYNYYGTVQ